MRPHTSKHNRSRKNDDFADPEALTCIEDLLKKNLRSLFLAEKSLTRAYHHFMKTAHCEDLQDHFFSNQQSCKVRMQRLENILGRMGEVDISENKHPIADVLVENAEQICEQRDGTLRDIQIICGAIEGESYLVSGYRSATEFCETLGQYKMGELLDTSLGEKENALRELGDLLKTWLEKAHEQEESVSSSNLIHH